MRRCQQQRVAVVLQERACRLKSVVIVFFSSSQKKKPTPRAWVIPISSCFASIESEAKSSPESHGRQGHHVAALQQRRQAVFAKRCMVITYPERDSVSSIRFVASIFLEVASHRTSGSSIPYCENARCVCLRCSHVAASRSRLQQLMGWSTASPQLAAKV